MLVVGSSLLFVLAAALWRSWGATSGLDGAAGSSCSARPRLDEKLFLESFSQPAPKKPAAAKKR